MKFSGLVSHHDVDAEVFWYAGEAVLRCHAVPLRSLVAATASAGRGRPAWRAGLPPRIAGPIPLSTLPSCPHHLGRWRRVVR